MTTLINDKHLLKRMASTIAGDLVGKVSELLDVAMPLIPTKGYSINLYFGKPYSYIAHSDEIEKWWVGFLPGGNRIGRWATISREEFLEWVSVQPEQVRKTVYSNLETYIKTETPTERGEVEFPDFERFFYLD